MAKDETSPDADQTKLEPAPAKKSSSTLNFLSGLLRPTSANSAVESALSQATDHASLELMERDIARGKKPRL